MLPWNIPNLFDFEVYIRVPRGYKGLKMSLGREGKGRKGSWSVCSRYIYQWMVKTSLEILRLFLPLVGELCGFLRTRGLRYPGCFLPPLYHSSDFQSLEYYFFLLLDTLHIIIVCYQIYCFTHTDRVSLLVLSLSIRSPSIDICYDYTRMRFNSPPF